MGVQLTAGMECHGVVLGGDQRRRLGGKGIGADKGHIGAIPLGQQPTFVTELILQLQTEDRSLSMK